MNLIIILIGIAASFTLGICLGQARRPADDDGLFITHEELGMLREEWIEFGKALGKIEAEKEKEDNSPSQPRNDDGR